MWTDAELRSAFKQRLGKLFRDLATCRKHLASSKLSRRERSKIFSDFLDAAYKDSEKEYERRFATEKAKLQQEIAQLQSLRQNRIERDLEAAGQAIQRMRGIPPFWKRILEMPVGVAEFAHAVMEEANGTLPRIHVKYLPVFAKQLLNRIEAKRRGVVSFHSRFNGMAYDFYGFPHQMPTRERQRYLDAGRQNGLELLSGKIVPRAKKRGLEKTAQRNQFMRKRFLELKDSIASPSKRIRSAIAEATKKFNLKRPLTYETARRICMSTKWGGEPITLT